MAAAHEREVKFQVESGSAVEHAVEALADGAPRRVEQIESVYFDTPKMDLRARGLSLRVRRNGDRYIQTMKRVDGVGVTFRRWESEHDVPGPAPELDEADSKALAAIALRVRKETFRPMFTVTAQRTRWDRQCGAASVEFALDRGEVTAGDRSAPIEELEIELKQGDSAALFGLARDLGRQVVLRPALITKDDRGYRLLNETWGRAAHAEPTSVDRTMSARQAFRVVALNCLQQYTLNELVLRKGFDSGAIHQARVAVRRLRSALSLFAPILRDDKFDAVKADLRRLSDMLGAVRDMDVFHARTIAPRLTTATDIPGFDQLGAYVESLKHARFATLLEQFNTDAHREALLNVIEWVEIGLWTSGPDESAPALTFAVQRFRTYWRRLRRATAKFETLSHEQLHNVRKRAKRLRYMAQFFLPALKPAQVKRWRSGLNVLEKMQDILGRHHDLVFAQSILASVASDGSVSPGASFAAGHMHGQTRRRLKAMRLRGAEPLIARLKERAPF
jgi:inorganic triphosphatase YgiF